MLPKKKKSFFCYYTITYCQKSRYLIIGYFTLILMQHVLALDILFCGFAIYLIICTTAKYKIL